MPITLQCTGCGKTLQAPDTAAGRKARCPQCGTITDVPVPVGAIAEAPGLPPAAPLPAPPPVDDGLPTDAPGAAPGAGYDLAGPPAAPAAPPEAPADGAGAGADQRRPCPMCGESIPMQAMKCRFCGSVLDASLQRLGPGQAGIVPGPGGAGLRKPGKVTALSVLVLVSGITNCAYGLMLVLGCWTAILAPLPIVLGIFEILYAAKLLSDPIKTNQPSQVIAILEIVSIIFCNVLSVAVGIVSLVFYADPEVKQYFAEGGRP